jgi:hypothetical protein
VAAKANGKATDVLEPTSDDGNDIISLTEPVIVDFTLTGVCPMLFHRWSVESVAEKSAAAKGSAAKKTDDVQSYVWRNSNNQLCLPGEYVRQVMVNSAKFRPDPRSPRASMAQLMKAAIVPLTDLAPLNGGVTDWDFMDQRRVMVQRNGVTRSRPAFNEGWTASFQFMINLPEYVSPTVFQQVLENGGRVVGIADFRPTYGRFLVTNFAQTRFEA